LFSKSLIKTDAFEFAKAPKHLPKLVEPAGPVLNSKILGPESISLLKQYAAVSQDNLNVKIFTDYKHSIGNYLCDADSNLILDLVCQDGSSAIGYNHPRMVEFSRSSSIKLGLLQRSACAIMPSSEWIQQVSKVLMPLAPKGLTEVFNSCGCSASSNENAIKTASLWFFKQKYGENYSKEQLDSALLGKFPGIPSFVLVRFSGSFHGNYLGGNSASDSPHDYPRIHWPMVSFPKSASEEANSLEQVDWLFKTSKDPIMAVIIEPIQQVGNYFATKSFYL
jgi:4-aminobutyrate aminotransferase/(S)-3-amino-2-methylpropionate transaminase